MRIGRPNREHDRDHLCYGVHPHQCPRAEARVFFLMMSKRGCGYVQAGMGRLRGGWVTEEVCLTLSRQQRFGTLFDRFNANGATGIIDPIEDRADEGPGT